MLNIVVCGSNRSGTSMLMQCLEEQGIHMNPDMFIGADEGNVHGYYEDKRFKSIVRDMRCAKKLKPYGKWAKIPQEIAMGYLKWRLECLCNDRFGAWAWKYPASVYVLDELNDALDNPWFIYMHRSKERVVKSMIRHSRVTGQLPYPREVYESWYDKSQEAIKSYHGDNKLIVEFNHLFHLPVECLQEIFDCIGYNYRVEDVSCIDSCEVHF